MEMFKLVKANNLLPAEMDDLVPLSFIGQAAIAFYRAKIKVMNQLGMTEAQRKATLRDGQDAGEMLLDIEARIGELLPSREDVSRFQKGNLRHSVEGKGRTLDKILPEGMTRHRAQQSRHISENPTIVAKIKAQAKENEDIPTKTAVLNAIHYEKEKDRQAAADKNRTESTGILAIEQSIYLNALDRCISVLPQKPPQKWNENAFREAKAKAIIIRRRLEVFNG